MLISGERLINFASVATPATYVTWENFTLVPSTLQELRTQISEIPRLQLVNACAVISSLLQTWQGRIDLAQHKTLLYTFFSPTYASRLDNLARSREPRFVFHRQQLLFLIDEALTSSPDGPDLENDFPRRFAEVCLRTNDLLPHGLALNPRMSEVERLLPELVTVNDYSVTYSLIRRAARTRIFLEILSSPEIKNRPEFIDVSTEFAEITGISIREYFNLILALLTKYLILKPADHKQGALRFGRQYFHSAKIKNETVDRFLKDISGDFDELRQDSTKFKHLNDFTALRRKPILKIGDDSFLALDVTLLADKLDNGVFWRVHDSFTDNKLRDKLHNLWGQVFHQYVKKMLESIAHCGQFFSCPQFDGAAEACDGILKYGSVAVVMEFKGSMLTAEAKYSGKPDLLIQSIETKFVGTEASPKGVRQLARTIIRWANKSDPQPIPGIDFPRKIFPVLIGRESALGSPLMNYYLDERLTSLFNRKLIRATVTPLFVLTIDELEQIVAHLDVVRFCDLLESKYSAEDSTKWPFSGVTNTILNQQAPKELQLLNNTADQIFDDVCMDLFGKSFKAAQSDLPDKTESKAL
jgi:hypothetical protein